MNMKIGILVHSKTGNTKRFAELISIKLTAKGHVVELTELVADGKVDNVTARQPLNFNITNLPNINDYDTVMVGGPVWAFSPSPVAYKAVQQLKNLTGKSFMAFMTMGFPLTGMGGKGSLRMLNREASKIGAKIITGVVIPHMFHNFNTEMEKAADKIVQML